LCTSFVVLVSWQINYDDDDDDDDAYGNYEHVYDGSTTVYRDCYVTFKYVDYIPLEGHAHSGI